MRNCRLIQLLLCCLAACFISISPLHAAQENTLSPKELRKLLKAMADEQSIHPDSIFPNIQKLEKRKIACDNPTERAIMNAILGYLYDKHCWQASRYNAQSESDSTDMNTWTREDFQAMCARRFSEALTDLDILHAAKQKNWLPILERGKDDRRFGKDMLIVIWRAAQTHSRRAEYPIPTHANIINYYNTRVERFGEKECREGILELTLENMSTSYSNRDKFRKLIDEYGDLKDCAEVYLCLAQCEQSYHPDATYDKDSMAVAWLKEGIRRYPGYKRIKALKERLDELQAPSFRWNVLNTMPPQEMQSGAKRFADMPSHEDKLSTSHPYPGLTYNVALSLKNVTYTDFLLYKRPKDFDSGAYNKSKDGEAYLEKHATRVGKKQHVSSPHQPWESFVDTLQWTIPETGAYYLVMQAHTKGNVKEKMSSSIASFYVSRLMASYLELPQDRRRVIVNDVITGAPQKDVHIDLYSVKEDRTTHRQDTTYHLHALTDAEGKFDFDMPKSPKGYVRNDIITRIWREGDENLPTSGPYYSSFADRSEDDKGNKVELYTDRSIYRPGQTVHVGGIYHKWKQWTEGILPSRTMSVKVYDPNNKVLEDGQVKTDDFGVFSYDFELPSKGLPGRYRITCGGETKWVRMEEYKRPTFEVTCDEAPALQMPADTITLSGKATNYNGAPVHGARVACNYNWDSGFRYYWMDSEPIQYDLKADTVLTDEEGRFNVRIPIKTAMSYGRMLMVKYNVTSPTGETHEAETSLYISSSPLSLHVNVPRMVDRDMLKPWSLMLTSSTGQEVKGDVHVTLRQGKNVAFETNLPCGASVTPTAIQQAPSGRYDIEFLSVANGDTATTKVRNIVIFSQHDAQVPVDTTLWFYVPQPSFSKDTPARVQVGSSKDAWLYYTITDNNKVLQDRLYHLNDTLMTIDIPYEERYDKGIALNVCLIRNGERYTQSQTFLLKQPDRTLRHKWVTFRDKLQPGQKETWRLELTRPDGTPATANLMASLYDASLDAILSHNWHYSHTLKHFVRNFSYERFINGSTLRNNIKFRHREYDIYDWVYSSIDTDLFISTSYGRVKRFSASSSRGAMAIGGGAPGPLMEARLMAKSVADTDGAVMNMDMEEDMAAPEASNGQEEKNEAGDPVVTLRENFDETAFFMPCLRTDSTGQVALEFTLLESLTTWRLLGLAHTQDMLTTLLDEKIVAQKDLMAQTMLPRFLRQGDKAYLSASVFNISEAQQKGRAVLTILDAQSEKVLHRARYDFNIKAKTDSTFLVPFDVPEDAGMLIIRWAAEGSTCSDGEQHYLPVLSNKEWVTETRALTYTKPGKYTEDLQTLFPVKTATNRRLTVEYTSQPVWYAIQALPSLAWPKQQDILSLATAYFAGSISQSIVDNNPRIKTAYSDWMTEDINLNSKLMQNEDVKNIALEETPWVALAERESTQKQRIASLFDEATQSSLQKAYLDKMRKLQLSDGSFTWYPGMKGSYYLTREVAYLLTRQKVMTGSTEQTMLQNAISYIRQDRPTWLSTSSLRYLYVLYNSGTTFDRKDKHNADSLLRILEKHPEHLDLEQRALAALVLHKAGKAKSAKKYLESVTHFLVTNNEGLTYFEFPQGAFTSINRKLHIHVQAMEAIATLTPKDTLLDGMRRYLLRHKRTSEWDTPMNTANAVYALLLNNQALLSEVANDELTLGQGRSATKLETQTASLGYTRQAIDLNPTAMPKQLTIDKTGKQESWGGLYAQYLAPLADIEASTVNAVVDTTATKGLRIEQKWPTQAKVGDKITVRYTITADRDYEYVAVHAPRPAACEPLQQLSGFTHVRRLGYYRAVKDVAVEFFFDYLPRGTYVLEEELVVERPGQYSAGITNIQCLYAPEFSSHTSDARLTVSK